MLSFAELTLPLTTAVSCGSSCLCLLGFGVQLPWRQEEQRPVCDWLSEGAPASNSAHTGHSEAGSVGWLVH